MNTSLENVNNNLLFKDFWSSQEQTSIRLNREESILFKDRYFKARSYYENYTDPTTEVFDKFWSDYSITACYIVKYDNFYKKVTALSSAIEFRKDQPQNFHQDLSNKQLLNHVINKIGKKALLIDEGLDCIQGNKLWIDVQLLKFLHSRGADINLPLTFTNSFMEVKVSTPLDRFLERSEYMDYSKRKIITDLYVGLGAKLGFSIRKKYCYRPSDNFDILYMAHHASPASTIRKVNERKFEFFKAYKFRSSVISSLPIELIKEILTAGESTSIDPQRIIQSKFEIVRERLIKYHDEQEIKLTNTTIEKEQDCMIQ